jgi:hypothetical protein
LSEIKGNFRRWCPGAELNHRHLHFQFCTPFSCTIPPLPVFV